MAEETATPTLDEAATPSGYATITLDGVEVSSNSETEAQLREALTPPPAEPPAEDAVAEPPLERDPKTGQFAKPAKPRNDPHARVQEATSKEAAAKRERDEARAERDAARAELAAARAPRQQPAPQPEPAKQPDPAAVWQRYKAMPDAPKLDQFETIEDYNFAVGLFVNDKRAEEREVSRQEETQRQQQEHNTRVLDAGWQTRLTDARTKDPARIAAINPATPLNAPMMYLIKKSPIGVEILEHLSQHLDDAQRLSTLHPEEVLWEMGKLEARLDAAPVSGPAPIVPAISHAKPPIKPLGTTALHATDDPPGDDASDAEHDAYWGKRRQKYR